MTKQWPVVRLGEVIQQRRESITIDDLVTYKRARVQLHAQGVVLRDEVPGAMVKTKSQQVCRVGEFLVAEIDAKAGGYGIVPDLLDGAIVSSHYFLFAADESRLDRRFLAYFARTTSFSEQVKAQGSTNYAAIRPANVLSYKMPLPPLMEQHRIVDHLSRVAAQIDRARELRNIAIEEACSLCSSRIVNLFKKGASTGWAKGQLGDFITEARYGTSERATGDTSGTPILRMGNIQNGRLDIADLRYLQLSDGNKSKMILNDGDILVNRTNSAELVGKCAVFDLPGEYSFASYLIRLRIDKTRALPKLVAAYINSPIGRTFMTNAKKQMTGQANVNATTLKSMEIALPSLAAQERIASELSELQMHVESLRQEQRRVAEDLRILLTTHLARTMGQ